MQKLQGAILLLSVAACIYVLGQRAFIDEYENKEMACFDAGTTSCDAEFVDKLNRSDGLLDVIDFCPILLFMPELSFF